MLQWMGGSRRKVTASRKSTQKRQKQYFEQRKRQQQHQQQTAGLDSYDNEMDISEEHHKEHRSLDVISLMNLSKISQECRSACPSVFPSCKTALGRKNLEADASKVEFDISDGSVVTQSGSVVQPDEFVQFRETRIPSSFQMETASSKKIFPRARDSYTNTSKQYQRETSSEEPLSVLDLLVDDEMNTNTEGSVIHEDHVAFSVEGLGKVGTKTPLHSPQHPIRAFPYSFSSAAKASGQLNLSKKFNCLLGDLDTEVDARMQDFNIPLYNTNHLDFSSDYMNLLSSPKQKSFTFRAERQSDVHSNKKNRYLDPHEEDNWDDRSGFQFDSFFDQKDRDTSWKSRQRVIDDNVANDLRHRAYGTPDFAYEDPHIPIRGEKVTEKFDTLGSTSPFSKLDTSEYDQDFFNFNWSRQPAVERKFHSLNETRQPERFTTNPEDTRENSSLQSEESCSSTAVRNQAIDDSLSNATSKHSTRRGFGNSCFTGSGGNKYGTMKPFTKETKHESQPVNTKMSDRPDLKAKHRSSSLFQKNLEAKGNLLFEKTCAEVETSQGNGFFDQNSGTKQSRFDSDIWDEDPFCKSPKEKNGAKNGRDGFFYEPAGHSSSEYFTPVDMNIPSHDSPKLTKPEELSLGETVSPDISVQESISKDVKSNAKSKSSNFETFEPGEEIFTRNEAVVSEGKVATEASNSLSNGCDSTEAKDRTAPQSTEPINMAFLPDLVEDITKQSGTPNREKERISRRNGDHDSAYKSPRPYRSGKKENMEEFGPKDGMGYKQKSNYFESPRQAIMLQGYVFQLFSVQKRLY